MTYAVSLTTSTPTPTNRRGLSKLVGLTTGLGQKRANQRDRVRARRTALAMSEEARIHAQMRYRQMRYRHVAS